MIDRLDDGQARRLSEALRAAVPGDAAPLPRPLTPTDIVLPEPILPDDETADDMIATVRAWRRDGGYA